MCVRSRWARSGTGRGRVWEDLAAGSGTGRPGATQSLQRRKISSAHDAPLRRGPRGGLSSLIEPQKNRQNRTARQDELDGGVGRELLQNCPKKLYPVGKTFEVECASD